MVTTTPLSDLNPDIFIYAERSGSAYRLRYEIQTMLSNEVVIGIRARLEKSFSLGRTWPDSYTESGIRQKAELMKNILSQSFGLRSSIIENLR